MSADGEIQILSHERARTAIHNKPVLVCHAPYTCTRLGVEDILAFDILELYAFVHPASFCVPTPFGLAKALGVNVPQTLEDTPFTLIECVQALLRDIQSEPREGKKSDPVAIAEVMGLQGKGWNWTPFVMESCGVPYDQTAPIMGKTALNVWRHMPEWAEEAPPPPPAHYPVTGEESRERLAQLLSLGNRITEPRPQQVEFATAMTAAFAPLADAKEPHLVLAEAGTGVGKTLGYLAPASVWAEKNDGTVWISTYTKNLQRQIGQELDRLYPDPELKDKKIAMRKGRENYLCLLNLEDSANGASLAHHPHYAIAAGLMARWAEVTKDGDMQGGDFPGWLPGLLGYQQTLGLADKRGECIYGACDHYHRCFVERSVRKSQRAQIVVANHALVMRYTADSGLDSALPKRYIFDEGHHLFDAADGAFAAHLTARETTDLRRWLLGPEGGKKSRARGLKKRIEDLILGDTEAESELEQIIHMASQLTAQGWAQRLKDGNPQGPTEAFLMAVYQQIYARADGRDGPYSLEIETRPLIDELPDKIKKLKDRLRDLHTPMRNLSALLRKKMNDNAQTWDSDTRKRVDSVCVSMGLRILNVSSWIGMLDTLLEEKAPEQFIDWMEIERIDGKAYDVGMYRHYVDPMVPFATSLKPHAHGIAIASATLRDRTGDEAEDWRVACERTGAPYLSDAPTIFATPSPYDYAAQTRIFIVNDVRKDDMDQVAAAYRVLFEAAGGGALGLFTAIQRLRAVQKRILEPLDEKDIRLYAQHVDAIDTGTLVDIFREDTHACLLGTDAVRDGIDVPGESLRLLVYDRVPWPRPTILHKARRDAFGGRKYDELMTRLKLRQAYGRLTRRATDRGVFVMLDSMLPTKLQSAFPEGVVIEKTGLADCAKKLKDFLYLSQ